MADEATLRAILQGLDELRESVLGLLEAEQQPDDPDTIRLHHIENAERWGYNVASSDEYTPDDADRLRHDIRWKYRTADALGPDGEPPFDESLARSAMQGARRRWREMADA